MSEKANFFLMATVEQAVTWLKRAEHPLVLTGAGISAESGIPTFRGKEGLWKNYRAEDLATPQAFARDSKLVWQWYNWRKDLVKSRSPNAAHYALADLQKQVDVPIVTQNVDGFHRLARNQNVVEMHGNIFESRCTGCQRVAELIDTSSDQPACEKCGGLLRPNIVWFGEGLDGQKMQQIAQWLSVCDLLLVIGTSGVVYPAAGFASQVRQHGGTIIEINLETAPDSADYLGLNGRAGEILPRLVAAL